MDEINREKLIADVLQAIGAALHDADDIEPPMQEEIAEIGRIIWNHGAKISGQIARKEKEK